MLGALKKRNILFVRLNTPVRGQGPRVYMDDRAAARQATKHLLGLGHTRIGMIAGDYKFSSSTLRVETFQATMEAAGHPAPDERIHKGDFTFEAGVAGAGGALGLAEPPTAIMASNDQMALGVGQRRPGAGLGRAGRAGRSSATTTRSACGSALRR